mmetsp:Transcript_122412/g.192029  ORF Transcript_122412/g.192029 Transcript_122412/m.192029 type:complete len:216 (-) Transcript_122412:24-671(-)
MRVFTASLHPCFTAVCKAVSPFGSGDSKVNFTRLSLTCFIASAKADASFAHNALCTMRGSAPNAILTHSSSAASIGNSPPLSRNCGSALKAIIDFMHSALLSAGPFPIAAACKGAEPRRLFCALGSALHSNNAFTASTLPQIPPMCNAVCPTLFAYDGGQPSRQISRIEASSLSLARLKIWSNAILGIGPRISSGLIWALDDFDDFPPMNYSKNI